MNIFIKVIKFITFYKTNIPILLGEWVSSIMQMHLHRKICSRKHVNAFTINFNKFTHSYIRIYMYIYTHKYITTTNTVKSGLKTSPNIKLDYIINWAA